MPSELPANADSVWAALPTLDCNTATAHPLQQSISWILKTITAAK